MTTINNLKTDPRPGKNCVFLKPVECVYQRDFDQLP